MDELLQKALERRDQLRRELEAVDKFIRDYSFAAPQKPVQIAEQPSLFPVAKRGRAERAQIVMAMMEAAERYILEASQPLTRFQILRRLQDDGFAIEGTDKSKVLGTNLWRSRRFYNIQGAGYWPRSEPLPSGYEDHVIRDSALL